MSVFDGTNYTQWKARMKSSLKSIDERVWILVERWWAHPSVTADNVTNLKSATEWTEDEFK